MPSDSARSAVPGRGEAPRGVLSTAACESAFGLPFLPAGNWMAETTLLRHVPYATICSAVGRLGIPGRARGAEVIVMR